MRNWLRTRPYTCLGNKILCTRGLKPIERNLGTSAYAELLYIFSPQPQRVVVDQGRHILEYQTPLSQTSTQQSDAVHCNKFRLRCSFDVPPFSRLYGHRYLDQDYCLSVQPNSVDLHRGMMLSAWVRSVWVATLNGRVAAVCCAGPTPSVLFEKGKFQPLLGISGVSAVNVVLHLSGSLCAGYSVGVHPH